MSAILIYFIALYFYTLSQPLMNKNPLLLIIN